MEDRLAHINTAINIANTVRTTLGPRGMNKLVMNNQNPILTNDGATIIRNIHHPHPIMDSIKALAFSQEQAVGDGTTTSMILIAELLENALTMINQGIHQTNIINGYNIAASECVKFLKTKEFDADRKKVIKTCFGAKTSKEFSEHLSNILVDLDIEDLQIYKFSNSNPLKTEVQNGFIFEGFTINDQMPTEGCGKIAVLDTRGDLELTKFEVTKAEELENITKYNRDYKQGIVDKLVELGVKTLFYSDTNPELETLLTESGIMSIVTYDRSIITNICKSTGSIVIGDPKRIEEKSIGNGTVTFLKNPNRIIIKNKDSKIKTLILHGSTKQTLDESGRAIDDVVGLLRNSDKCVYGAGSIEIDISLHLNEFSKNIGGKEQIVVERFANAIESIPITLAKNCGFDAIDILTSLKSMHREGDDEAGVDDRLMISSTKDRGIIEPTIIKMHSILGATEVCNLVLKLDDIYNGEETK